MEIAAIFINRKNNGSVELISVNNFLDWLVNSWFCSPKRSVSRASLLKERMTLIPVRFSLKIRFSPSSAVCWRSLMGPEIFATSITPRIIKGTVAAITRDKRTDDIMINVKLITIITGVSMAVLRIMFMKFMICSASLLVLVISEDTPSWFISRWEKLWTFSNRSFLISQVTAVDILAPQ